MNTYSPTRNYRGDLKRSGVSKFQKVLSLGGGGHNELMCLENERKNIKIVIWPKTA